MKDNPLEGASRYGNQTVWLDRENAAEARENYWAAMNEHFASLTRGPMTAKAVWDIAWAAAIAAHSYINEGRIAPK